MGFSPGAQIWELGGWGEKGRSLKNKAKGGWVFVSLQSWGSQDVRNYEELNSYEKPRVKPKPKLRKHNESSAR